MGTPLCDAPNIATAFTRTGTKYEQFRQQLLALFPTDRETATAFTRKYNALLKKAGDAFPDLEKTIADLICANGFTGV